MTKKIYEKPSVTTEEFDLSQNIASGCGCIVIALSAQGGNEDSFMSVKDFFKNGYTEKDIKHMQVYHDRANNGDHIYYEQYKNGAPHWNQHPKDEMHDFDISPYTYFFS